MANLNIPATRDRTLDAFKGKMIGGGARSNLFECEIYFPDAAIPDDSTKDLVSDKVRFLVKAAALPASTISNIAIPFRGRNLKIAGDRTFEPWTITVINDTDFSIRTSFERWMNLMNKHEDNAGLTDPTSYQQDLFVRQLGRSEVGGSAPISAVQIPVLKNYRFYGAFPTLVSSIDLSYENTDAIEEFTVEFQYQWYDALDAAGNTQLGTGS
jgi:hypothetical protein|tara:strand:- start:820 stop:1455 length:636 start_codon:yes stop_codon:yes gene_type:complete